MKLPHQLGSKPIEFAMLLATREYLKRPVIKHNPRLRNAHSHVEHAQIVNPKTRIFNMTHSVATADCGTVACIGGWMAALSGVKTRAEIHHGGLVLIDTLKTQTVMHYGMSKTHRVRPFAIDIYTHVNAGRTYPYASKRQNDRAGRKIDRTMQALHKAA